MTKLTKELRDALKAELAPILFALKDRAGEGNDLLSIIAAASGNGGLKLVINGENTELPTLQGDKGDKGDDGHSPVFGKDYFTEADQKRMLKAVTPIKGKDYFDGERGDAGHTPVKGKDYYTEEERKGLLLMATPVKGIHYFTPSEQATFAEAIKESIVIPKAADLTGHEIRKKLEALSGSNRLDYKAIKGLDAFVQNAIAQASGASSTSGGGSAGGGAWGTITGTLSAQTDLVAALALKANTSSLAAVALSGAYSDLSGRPSLATVATTGAYADLTGKPSLAAVATSGLFSDLSGALAYLNASNTVGDGATFGHDTGNGFRFGIYNSNWYGLWNMGVTPSTSNYALIARKDGTSVQYNSTDNISFNISDVSKLYINAVGNVGVGKTNQTYKLDVAGDVNIDTGSHFKINGVNLSYADVGADASGAAASAAAAAIVTAEAYADAAVAAGRLPYSTSMADATSITPTLANDALYQVNTQTAGTLTVNAPTGTPVNFQKLMIRLKCTNVQTFSFNAAYRFSTDLPAPTASTGGGKTDYLAFEYNAQDSKYDYVGKVFGF